MYILQTGNSVQVDLNEIFLVENGTARRVQNVQEYDYNLQFAFVNFKKKTNKRKHIKIRHRTTPVRDGATNRKLTQIMQRQRKKKRL